ncbi:MAG: HAMP domain-containing protein, partial [Alphaproteobacteria bacterium]|nr:HAMP domain-containing protein [Alphaproteobacteria bacterium]
GWVARAERATILLFVLIIMVSYLVLAQGHPGEKLLAPPLVAVLLVANLVPAILLLIFWGRRRALRRAHRSALRGAGRLHMRLVVIFSQVAALPMLLLVLFASLMFQYGVAFWFSDHARSILQNASHVAQTYEEEHEQRVALNAEAMAGDLRAYLKLLPMRDREFWQAYGAQVYHRELSESAIIQIDHSGVAKTLVTVNPYDRRFETSISPQVTTRLKHGEPVISGLSADRFEAITPLYPDQNVYLYAARVADKNILAETRRGQEVLGDYDQLLQRARRLQLYLNAALYIVTLLIVWLAVLIALRVADRFVRPVDAMMAAAQRVTEGDLSVRVPGPLARDEIGALARAFNTMTARLAGQNDALVGANALLERRRALTEAVLTSVSAGVIAVDLARDIRIVNDSARRLLRIADEKNAGVALRIIAPELDAMLAENEREGVCTARVDDETLTLAVKIAEDEAGFVLTFDDITAQINDQRRAAWADVARRIAHEIKNPLTPIQLAAERLQRRFGKEISSDPGIFGQLTETIIRQVGDLRRMVDEFSSFARIPKPVFRQEHLNEMARQALFLHEVAHPQIHFNLQAPDAPIMLVCDRRQLSQALINIIKNGVEAIVEKQGAEGVGEISMTLAEPDSNHVMIRISDTGVGLPPDRARLNEPYVTTRANGTGLGLAIVDKIIEDHQGSMTLADRPGGGTVVTLKFERLAMPAAHTAAFAESEL